MNGREHGTETGYQQHRQLSEQACGDCLWAHRLYNRRSRELVQAKKTKPRAPISTRPEPRRALVLHGTPQALELHTRSRGPVCETCMTAACDWERAQAARYLRRIRWAS